MRKPYRSALRCDALTSLDTIERAPCETQEHQRPRAVVTRMVPMRLRDRSPQREVSTIPPDFTGKTTYNGWPVTGQTTHHSKMAHMHDLAGGRPTQCPRACMQRQGQHTALSHDQLWDTRIA